MSDSGEITSACEGFQVWRLPPNIVERGIRAVVTVHRIVGYYAFRVEEYARLALWTFYTGPHHGDVANFSDVFTGYEVVRYRVVIRDEVRDGLATLYRNRWLGVVVLWEKLSFGTVSGLASGILAHRLPSSSVSGLTKRSISEERHRSEA
jgi:hypothetical protein